jgi:hypothetical protein
MKTIWFHEEMLTPYHPLLDEEGKKVFVWDNTYFKKQKYSFKRLVFIYECLQELPIEIIQGETEKVLSGSIITQWSPNPWIQKVVENLKVACYVTTPFVEINQDYFSKRFFGFWKKIEKRIF